MQILSTNFFWITLVHVITGFFLSGTVLFLFNGLLEVAKEETQTSFIANYNFFIAIVAFLAPQFGVLLLEVFSMSVAVNTSCVLRIIAGFMFLGMTFYSRKPSTTVCQLS